MSWLVYTAPVCLEALDTADLSISAASSDVRAEATRSRTASAACMSSVGSGLVSAACIFCKMPAMSLVRASGFENGFDMVSFHHAGPAINNAATCGCSLRSLLFLHRNACAFFQSLSFLDFIAVLNSSKNS